MVDRLTEQMETIRIVLCDDQSSSHLIPSWQDCDILLSITVVLKPLKAMTDALSGESCITISAVKPILNHIINELKEEDGDMDITKEIKERVKVDLELRYLGDEIGQLLELTSFLDPRFKLTHVNDRAGILKEIEMQMVEEMDTDVTATSTESTTRVCN